MARPSCPARAPASWFLVVAATLMLLAPAPSPADARIIHRRGARGPSSPDAFASAAAAAAAKALQDREDDKLLPEALPSPSPRAVDDPEIVEAANWAINHLRGMSDSGIYESLKLERIVEASSAEGIFHYNTFLTVVLSSPHLLDGEPTTTHKVIVMRELGAQGDGSPSTSPPSSSPPRPRSFAIDEFPIMEPDAIEQFWMRKVDASRARREIEFRKLEHETRRWQEREAALVRDGTRREGECLDACAEREEAARNYKWLTDDEFFEIERAEQRAEAAVGADGSV